MLGVWRTRDGDALHGGGAFQFERLFVRVTPWRVVLGISAISAYGLGLLLYLPAEAVAGKARDAVGTAWNGEASLDPGFAVGWKARPLQSVVALAPAGAFEVRGPDTSVRGEGVWRSGGPLLGRVEGEGSLRLVNAAATSLPFACDGVFAVSGEDLALAGGRPGTGRLRIGPGTCAGAGTVTASPAMTGDVSSDADGSGFVLADTAGAELMRARVGSDKVLRLTVTQAGAAVLPGTAPATLEIR